MEDVIDQLQIELTSSADNVNKGINDMIASLKKLENIGNRGNLKKVTSQLKGFQKLDFTNFCKQLGTIERRLTAISKLKDTLSSLSKTTIGDVTSDIKHTAANNANATIGATEEQAIDIDTGDARQDIESLTDEVRQFGEEFVIANNKVTSGNGDIENTVERLTRMIELQKEKVMELQAVWEVAMENGADESIINNAEMRMLRAQGTVETLEKQLATAQSKENVGTFSEQESAAVTQVQTDCNNLLQSFSAINQQIQDAKTQITAMLSEKQAEFSTDKNFVAGTSFVDGLDDKVQKLNNSLTILNAEFNEMQARTNPPSEEEWLQFENRVLSTRTQLKNLAAQAEKTANAVASIGDAGEESGKKTGGFASKFMASLKRIALYRIVRAVLKEITQAFQEGMENYVQYSEEANATMSELSSIGKQLSNTLGVTGIQLLTILLPAIQVISDVLIDLLNNLNYFLAVIQNKDSYTKAIKQTTDYADSLNNVQNSLLGIDEINKLSDNESTDYSSMFEEVAIGDGNGVSDILVDWTDSLTSFISTALNTIPSIFNTVVKTVTKLIKTQLLMIEEVVNAIPELLPEVAEMATELVDSLAEFIVDELPSLISTAGTIIITFVNYLIQSLPELIQAGTQILFTLIDGILAAIPSLISVALQLVIELVGALLSTETLTSIIDAGVTLIQNLITGIISTIGSLTTCVGEIIIAIMDVFTNTDWVSLGISILEAVLNGIIDLAVSIPSMIATVIETLWSTFVNGDWITLGINVLTSIINGLVSYIKNIPSMLSGVITAFKNVFTNTDWLSIGKNILTGIGDGIKNAVSSVVDTVTDACSSVWSSIKSFFGINSPSKLMRDTVGVYVAEGIGVGFEDEIANVTGDMRVALDTSMNTDFESNDISNGNYDYDDSRIYDYIRQGMYDAMSDAGSSDGGNITVQFVSDGQIKSEQIISAAERRNRRDGKKVISVEV